MSILIVAIIQERVSHSKDLQLITNLSKRTYWLSNFIFDLCLCILLCVLLTIVVKVLASQNFSPRSIFHFISQIGATANSNSQAEVHIYTQIESTGFFLLMFLMYSLASLPLIYVFAFIPKSELIGFIAFFIINTIGCFFDMVLDFIGVFSQAQLQHCKILIGYQLLSFHQLISNVHYSIFV